MSFSVTVEGGEPQMNPQSWLFFKNNTNTVSLVSTPQCAVNEAQIIEDKLPLDDESQRGRFGWVSFNGIHIPYIFRDGEKFCMLRILQSKILSKYISSLHPDIYSCTCIRSYYITDAESKLLNEINTQHCNGQFGRDQFTPNDSIMRLADAKELYTFLRVCYTKLSTNRRSESSDKCGFIRIEKESVVPYTVKDGLKYVPLFYFEGETDHLKIKAVKLEGWDLSYLKFCCKVQRIQKEIFASKTCLVISLSDIKGQFPPGTEFEEYWPSDFLYSHLTLNKRASIGDRERSKINHRKRY